MELLLNPPGHRDVCEIHDMVAVHVRDELCRQGMGLDTDLAQSDDGATAGVELQGDGPVSDEHPGASPARSGVWHASAGECDEGGERHGSSFVVVAGRVRMIGRFSYGCDL